MASTAAGEVDSQQLDVDAFAKRLFDLGEHEAFAVAVCTSQCRRTG